MENILEKLETLIDDIERDSQLTREETLKSLREIHQKAEDIHLSLEY